MSCALAPAGCADRTPPTLNDLAVLEWPLAEAPLGMRVALTSDEPVQLSVHIADGTRTEQVLLDEAFRTEHTVPILGLRPGRRHDVTFVAVDAAGNSRATPPMTIETDPVPADFPPLEVVASEPDRMEPGVTLFGTYHMTADGAVDDDYGLLVAVDAAGEVVWYYRAENAIVHAIPLRNGNLLYQAAPDNVWGTLVEIDLLGRVVGRWHSRAAADLAPPGSVGVDVDSLHHDMLELPSGHFAALGTELRVFGDYLASDSDLAAPRETRSVIGDVIVEFARDGSVLDEWHLLDLLDPYRIGYNSLDTGFWAGTYAALGHDGADAADWAHANALVYDGATDAYLVSLRHQDAIVRVGRGSGELEWILGPEDGWVTPWRERLLTPSGELDWPYHSHGVEVTPNGTLLLFDNGNHRAMPFESARPVDEWFSRVVEFDVDAAARRVRQVWDYDGAGERFFSSFLSDADWMSETGNVLITDGARVTEVDAATEDGAPATRRWARILEVTGSSPADTVFELRIVGDGPDGWHIYRAGRWRGGRR